MQLIFITILSIILPVILQILFLILKILNYVKKSKLKPLIVKNKLIKIILLKIDMVYSWKNLVLLVINLNYQFLGEREEFDTYIYY
jgi:hypothetical protein